MFVTDRREWISDGTIKFDEDVPRYCPRAIDESDDVLAALDELDAVLNENAERERALSQRINELRAARENGHEWTVILANEGGPSTVQLMSTILRRNAAASGNLRRSLTVALRAEGRTISEIAHLFGVSHQRISNVLRRVAKIEMYD